MDKGTAGQRGRIRAPRTLLASLAVILLALGAAALGAAHGSAAHGAGPLAAVWLPFAVAALIGGVAAITRLRQAVMVAPAATNVEARLHRGLLALAAVATAAVPLGLFFSRGHGSGQPEQTCPTPCPLRSAGSTPTGSPQPSSSFAQSHPPARLPLGTILLVAGSILGAVLLVALVVLLVNWLSSRGEAIEAAALPELPDDEEDASALGMAVLAGRGALEGEARAAIIGCYASMEDSLATAGVPRLASDSPADLLARATSRGLLGGPAPRLLAALFREARFSSHAMTSRHLDQARGALDEIAAQLASRATETTAADARPPADGQPEQRTRSGAR